MEDVTRAAKRASYTRWRKANPEKHAARNAAWAKANAEKVKASRKARREQQYAYMRVWLAENPDRLAGYRAKDYAAHRDGYVARAANRRAVKRDAFVETVDRDVVYERDGGICQLCDEAIGEAKWHVDHVRPLSKGGEHSYANVQLAHARCNLTKGTKAPV